MMMRSVKLYVLWFISIFGIDRLTKWLALEHLSEPIDVNAMLQFKLVLNRGISWGMFYSDHPVFFQVLTFFIACIVFGLSVYTFRKWQQANMIVAELAVLAGAISNVMDRYMYGGVIDFIHVHVGDWSWPIFNVADMAIVVGICWMFIEQYRES